MAALTRESRRSEKPSPVAMFSIRCRVGDAADSGCDGAARWVHGPVKLFFYLI